GFPAAARELVRHPRVDDVVAADPEPHEEAPPDAGREQYDREQRSPHASALAGEARYHRTHVPGVRHAGTNIGAVTSPRTPSQRGTASSPRAAAAQNSRVGGQSVSGSGNSLRNLTGASG